MKKLPLVSVIVPVYRVEKYLDQCVSSIVSQTYSNLEIILIDDGSPDACGKICDAWADRDERIQVIHQENRGQSAARNVGLDVATGGYISFVDSDDWIAADYILHMVQECRDGFAQICICDHSITGDMHLDVHGGETYIQSREEFTSGKELLHGHPEFLFAGRVIGALYAKALIEGDGIRFPVGRIHEDVFVLFQLLYPAQGIIFLPEQLYYYRQQLESTTHTLGAKSMIDRTELQIFRMDYMWDKEVEFYHRVELAAYQFYFGISKRQDKVSQDCGERLYAYLVTHSKGLLSNPYASHVEKRRYFLRFVLRPFLRRMKEKFL